ncbi:MAG: iron-containing alcohol dehydrogenase, partial [Myxococcota bacterium]
KAASDREVDIAEALRADELSAEGAATAVEELIRAIGLPCRLSEAGVTEAHIVKMVPKCMEDGCHPSNPRVCTAADMEALYRAAM